MHFCNGNSDERNEECLDQTICGKSVDYDWGTCVGLNVGCNALETMMAMLEYHEV
jgi:hypothetical protein